MTLRGTLNKGTVVLDEPAPWPDGTRVEVAVQAAEKKLTLAEKLLRHAGTVPDLPSDMAEQHDHYIHGTPKRVASLKRSPATITSNKPASSPC